MIKRFLNWLNPGPDPVVILALQKAHQEEKEHLQRELAAATQLLIAYGLREGGEITISKELFLIAADTKLTLDLSRSENDSVVARIMVTEDD